MLKIKREINQQDFRIVDLHFVKSEWVSLTWNEWVNLVVKGLIDYKWKTVGIITIVHLIL